MKFVTGCKATSAKVVCCPGLVAYGGPAISVNRHLPCGVTCAGKGFGSSKPQTEQKQARKKKKQQGVGSIDGGSKNAVEKAVRIAEGGRVHPVDAKQAAKGKLQFVTVKNWGSGEQADLGDLQVDSVSPALSSDAQRPFAEQLARHLELLEAQGSLKVAQADNARPLPPFDRWSFNERCYVQYLADQQSVHCILEAAIADATTVANTEHYGDQESGKGVWAALDRFTESRGLDRSLEVAADLNNLAKASSLPAQELAPQASPQAEAYGSYVSRLGRECVEGETLAERRQAGLRLLANAYCVQLTHLTSGMRIGASAADKLGLAPIRALHFYENYDDAKVRADPLRAFLGNVNAAGLALSSAEKRAVMDELERALPKIGQLLSSLAHED
ncbi:hypothetical protein WJX72_004033 [[Myrmecia] bisecta]|uniref:heme oxygenase (biliverdin-producing) n=1 Tax=[Myrmecia] bisecta TaxID=41462 RepID=A0AAW1Q6F1_9CHLO